MIRGERTRGWVSRSLAILAAGAALLSGTPSSAQETLPVTVRVVTYNIHHGEGTDRRFDLFRIAQIIKSLDPDLVALQEVDQGTTRASGAMQLDELAGLLGMHAAFGKAMDYQGGAYGVAVLSRWPLLGPNNQPLPSNPDIEPRTALSVHVRLGGDGPLVRFTTTHLENSREGPADRLAQVTHLNQLLTNDQQPSILGGDFNARSETDVLAILDSKWTNVATVTAPDQTPQPNRRGPRSDFILYRPITDWRVLEWQVIDAPVASDHRPVLAVLEWIGES